jgi:hypothetical protein
LLSRLGELALLGLDGGEVVACIDAIRLRSHKSVELGSSRGQITVSQRSQTRGERALPFRATLCCGRRRQAREQDD